VLAPQEIVPAVASAATSKTVIRKTFALFNLISLITFEVKLP